MGLIKSGQAPKAAILFSMKDVEDQARHILQKARNQAESLLRVAMEEAEQLKKSAVEQGREAGRREGIQQGREEGKKVGQAEAIAGHEAELSRAVEALNGAMRQIDESRKQLESDGLSEVVALAAAVARRVTKRQAMLDPSVLQENLRDVMKLVVRGSDVRVAIHPAQRVILQEAMSVLKLEWPVLEHAQIVEDPSLHAGGCRVMTLHGKVDGDIGVQLDRIIGELMPADAQPAEGGSR